MNSVLSQDQLRHLAQNPKLVAALKNRVKAERGKRSLKEFVRIAWPWIEPRELKNNWHIDLICEHLQAVTYGQIPRLLINIPPRMMKSRLVSVFWPVWSWLQDDVAGDDGVNLPTCGIGTKYLCFTYDGRLSLDMSRDCRAVVEADEFDVLYGDRVQLDPNQQAKRRFDNMGGGYRIATSVRSIATGFGGDVLNVDDPQKVGITVRAADDDAALKWFSEVLPSRLNDRKRGAICVTMQRIKEMDVSGYILTRDLGYHHLCLPMEFEANHPHVSGYDVRTEDGELLWPEHQDERAVNDLKTQLGSYATAGQLQQRPAPREGGMFKKAWLPIVPAVPCRVVDRVRAWDLAGTAQTAMSRDPDWTVGARVSLGADGIFYIEDLVRFRDTPANVHAAIHAVASHDGRSTKVHLPQDPGQAGKSQASYLSKILAGYNFRIKPTVGSKEAWATPFAAQAEAGNVRLVIDPNTPPDENWAHPFIDELCAFPNAPHDDQVDAVSQAFDMIVNRDDNKKQRRTARTFAAAW